MIHLTSFYQSPGCSNQLAHVLVAKDLTAGISELEPFELIENKIVKLSEIPEFIRNGTIFSGSCIAAFYCFKDLYGNTEE